MIDATRCAGGHGSDTAPQATIRVRYKSSIDGSVLATEDLCQRCADAMSLPWVRAQRTPIIQRG